MATNWGDLFVSALGGGFTLKVLDIGYELLKTRFSRSQSAKEFVDQHLDPLLKSADELVGKLRALAEDDFRPVHHIQLSERVLENADFSSLIFLFGNFWAQIEVIRKEGVSVEMARDKRGEQLQSFLDCLESRRVRIMERILQRAVGEVFLKESAAIPYIEFVREYETNAMARRWLEPLASFLSKLHNTGERQQLLQYGAVVHALIDTLDPNHAVGETTFVAEQVQQAIKR